MVPGWVDGASLLVAGDAFRAGRNAETRRYQKRRQGGDRILREENSPDACPALLRVPRRRLEENQRGVAARHARWSPQRRRIGSGGGAGQSGRQSADRSPPPRRAGNAPQTKTA